MHAAFPIVMFGAIALFVVLGVISMFTRNNLYDQIGQGGLTLGDERRTGAAIGESYGARGFDEIEPLAPAHSDEREREIRQMLQARSDRLVRRGEAPLDIDAEAARLEHAERFGAGALGSGGAHDSGLALEVRQLIVARNERRRRQGQPALDVDAEVARTLAELDP